MATDYKDVWNNILGAPGTQNVDVIASIHEDGVNNYLQAHFTIDNVVYHKTITKVFNTQTDSRTFTIKLDITSPVQIQFPPFKDASISNVFSDKKNWYKLESDHSGPEISALQDDTNKIQVYCNDVNITLEWPKLHPPAGDIKPWSFSLKTLKVFAEAFAILHNDQDGFYVSFIPTIVLFDVSNPVLLINSIKEISKSLPADEVSMLDACQDQFTDLLVIAFNILATEQAPKLIRNIYIPVPVISGRPVFPAVLNISQNCLTAGLGLDKLKAEQASQVLFTKEMLQLRAALDVDIENAGGITRLVCKNPGRAKNFKQLEIRSEEDIMKSLVLTTKYMNALEGKINNRSIAETKTDKSFNVDNAYAIGIDQYFFQTLINSVIPAPKSECTDWLTILDAVRGRACYWVKFPDPTVVINPDASLTGAVGVDIGGSIEACVKKFWDCSFSWDCGSLALSLKGRPTLTVQLLKNSGISLGAQIGGNLYFDVNLPFPFDKIINAFSSILFQLIMAIINILLGALRFVIINPELKIPQQQTEIKLLDFNSFLYVRPQVDGNTVPKNTFIGFSGGLVSQQKPN